MSLTRRQVAELRSAGWEVIETGPAVELRRFLRSLVGRRRSLGRVKASVMDPPPAGWSR
jgi:hypothetical protein